MRLITNSQTPAKNVAIRNRVIQYSDDIQLADPTLQLSGNIETLPALIVESLPPGGETTLSG